MQALTTTIQMIYKYFPNGNIKKKEGRNESNDNHKELGLQC